MVPVRSHPVLIIILRKKTNDPFTFVLYFSLHFFKSSTMRILSFFLLLTFVLNTSSAQDQYHTDLQNLLQTEYNLPVGEWVLYDSESQNLSNGINYGGSFSQQTVSDQLFSTLGRQVITNAGGNPWDSGWNIRNSTSVQTGDKLLAVFYIRSIGGPGKVNFFVENASTFAKEVILTLDIDEEWRRYIVPFESSANYNIGSLVWGYHTAFQAQTIEFGGFTGLNYDNNVALVDLPDEINNQFYGGWEEDAPWRATAADRIEELRKTDLSIQVNNTTGEAIANAAVDIEMQRHEFAFGSAVNAVRFADNSAQNVIYESKLNNLDGNGHGFNWVVFENDMKWPAWEDGWAASQSEIVNAVSWLRERNIDVRGHNLIWPGAENLPSDVAANLDNPDYIRERFNTHFETILHYPGLEGEIAEWDVINEIVTNRTLENVFSNEPTYTTGRELYSEIFAKVREEAPETGLWLNDYVTISNGNTAGSAQYDDLKQFLGEIVNSGAPIDGIGFQGHIGGFPNAIPSVLATFDDFYDEYGLKAKITEFDMASIVSEQLAADYLSDFLTATFSHPSMDGFLFWSFWDGATWQNPGSNFFRLNWTPTPALEAFNALVFDAWWTNTTLVTNAGGQATERVFKGTYLISYLCDGETVSEELDITEASTYTIICDNITTPTNELDKTQGLRIFPNPAQDMLFVENETTKIVQLRLFDLSGKILHQSQSSDAMIPLDVQGLKGLYLVELTSDAGSRTTRIVVE